MTGIEYRLGEISAELKAINQRLDDGSKRHADLDEADDEMRERVVKLEMIEAKRAGVFVTIAGNVGKFRVWQRIQGFSFPTRRPPGVGAMAQQTVDRDGGGIDVSTNQGVSQGYSPSVGVQDRTDD